MEKLSNNQWKVFKGMGWLLAIALSIAGALVVFTLSDSFTAAVSAAIPIGVFAGTSLEQKFQTGIEQSDSKKTKMMVGSLLFGFIIFVAIYIFLHL